MLQAGWLIVHLIAGAISASGAAPAAAPTGISCTYQACMMKCGGLNGPICNSYCEVKIRQRTARGLCPAQGDDMARVVEIK